VRGFPRGDTCSWCFIYLFYMYMITDLLFVELETLIRIHHIVCIAGHTLVLKSWKTGFPLYFTGAAALELGSAGMNLYLVYNEDDTCAIIYAFVMTISNIIAVICSYQFALIPEIRPRIMAYVLGPLLTTGLAFIRQKVMIELVQEHFSD